MQPALWRPTIYLGAMKAFLQRTLNPFKYLLNVSVAAIATTALASQGPCQHRFMGSYEPTDFVISSGTNQFY